MTINYVKICNILSIHSESIIYYNRLENKTGLFIEYYSKVPTIIINGNNRST